MLETVYVKWYYVNMYEHFSILFFVSKTVKFWNHIKQFQGQKKCCPIKIPIKPCKSNNKNNMVFLNLQNMIGRSQLCIHKLPRTIKLQCIWHKSQKCCFHWNGRLSKLKMLVKFTSFQWFKALSEHPIHQNLAPYFFWSYIKT